MTWTVERRRETEIRPWELMENDAFRGRFSNPDDAIVEAMRNGANTNDVRLVGIDPLIENAVWELAMRAVTEFPDRVAMLVDGWAVRFRGAIQAPRWKDRKGAEAFLDALQKGERRPEPERR